MKLTTTRPSAQAILMTARIPVIAAIALWAGCAPAHTGAYKQKKREYTFDKESDSKKAAVSEGSLWQDGRPASMLFTM